MIAWSAGLIALTLLWVLIQFGIVAALFLVGIFAIVIAALIGLVIWIIAKGSGIFTERKYGAHF